MDQPIIIIVTCLLLTVFALWRELARSNRRNLWFRISALIISIISLACIILPVSYNSDVSANNKDQAILLTEGFNIDSLSKFSGGHIYTLDKSVKKEYQKAVLINSIDELPKLKPLNIFGYGLNEDELIRLNSLPVKFIPAKKPDGIQAVN